MHSCQIIAAVVISLNLTWVTESFSQDIRSPYNLKDVKVRNMDGTTITGRLIRADSSKITIRRYAHKTKEWVSVDLTAREIDWIKIRKNGPVVVGVILGIAVGGAIGAAIGAGQETGTIMRGTTTAYFGVIGALFGGLIGGGIGSIKGKIEIAGDNNRFTIFVAKLELH